MKRGGEVTERLEKSETGVGSQDSRCLSHGRDPVSPLLVQPEGETGLDGILLIGGAGGIKVVSPLRKQEVSLGYRTGAE